MSCEHTSCDCGDVAQARQTQVLARAMCDAIPAATPVENVVYAAFAVGVAAFCDARQIPPEAVNVPDVVGRVTTALAEALQEVVTTAPSAAAEKEAGDAD